MRVVDGVTLFMPPCPEGSQVNLKQPDVHAESEAQLYPIGTLAWYAGLGMKYRYSKAGTAHPNPRQLMYNGNLVPDASSHLNEDGFYGHTQVDGADKAYAAGITEISITDTIDRVKDYYAGSYMITWDAAQVVYERSYIISGPAAPTTTPWQNTILKLHKAKKYAIDSGEDIEIWLNPYSNIVRHDWGEAGAARQFQTVMGVAEIPIQDGYYFWLQTAGPVFAVPNGWTTHCPGYAANKREVYAIATGGLIVRSGATSVGDQRVGTLLSRTLAGSADAWFNMDLDIGH